jgi:hypothetical protein
VIVSSPLATVPHVLRAPTVIALGALPGDEMLPSTGLPRSSLPALPAEATTTRPAATARSAATHSGSATHDSTTGWPSDRFMTRMRRRVRLASTHWMPAMTSLV